MSLGLYFDSLKLSVIFACSVALRDIVPHQTLTTVSDGRALYAAVATTRYPRAVLSRPPLARISQPNAE